MSVASRRTWKKAKPGEQLGRKGAGVLLGTKRGTTSRCLFPAGRLTALGAALGKCSRSGEVILPSAQPQREYCPGLGPPVQERPGHAGES